jgi:hypothetical protein
MKAGELRAPHWDGCCKIAITLIIRAKGGFPQVLAQLAVLWVQPVSSGPRLCLPKNVEVPKSPLEIRRKARWQWAHSEGRSAMIDYWPGR